MELGGTGYRKMEEVRNEGGRKVARSDRMWGKVSRRCPVVSYVRKEQMTSEVVKKWRQTDDVVPKNFLSPLMSH